MSVRMRHTKSHTANRRSHHALSSVQMSKCSHCGVLHMPHRMCAKCGYYNGRQVVDVLAKSAKKEKKAKAKAGK